jgi:PKD repeat protein
MQQIVLFLQNNIIYLPSMTTVNRFFSLIFVLTFVSWSSISAQENYNQWSHSLNITINTSPTGIPTTVVLKQFPVLVRLDKSNFPFFDSVKTGGADIRFSSGNGNHLAYEIERWNNNPGANDSAEIWVKTDSIMPGDSTQSIVLYWGNSSAADSSNGAAVFNGTNNFSGVYHLAENDKSGVGTAGYYKDATGKNHGYDSIGSNTDNTGYIGRGHKFGRRDAIPVGSWNPSNEKLTLSAWVKWSGDTTYWQAIIAKRNKSGVYWELNYSSNAKPKGITVYNGTVEYGFGSMFSANSWHHVALASKNGVTNETFLYVDGVKVGTQTAYWGSQTSADIIIGNTDAYRSGVDGPDSGGTYWRGYLDEVRVEKTAHSEEWINVCYQNQRVSDQKLLSFHSKPIITIQPASMQISVPDTASFSISAYGDSLVWQWYRSTDTIQWNIEPGISNTPVYRFKSSPSDSNAFFRCIVSNKYGSDTSSVVRLKMCSTITFKAQPLNVLDCPVGKLVSFAVATNDTSHKYQWETSADGILWDAVKDANLSTLSFTAQATSKAAKYRCKIISMCDSAYSDVANFTICKSVTILSKPGNLAVIEGKTASFSIGTSERTDKYQWYTKKSGVSAWSIIPDAVDSLYSLITKTTDNSSLFRCIVKNTCDSVISDSVQLTVYNKVHADFTLSDSIGQAPLTVNFTDSSTGDITSHKWVFGDTATFLSQVASNPVHSYKDANVYYVKLIVSGPGGIDSMSKSIKVYSAAGNPVIMSGTMISNNKIQLLYKNFSTIKTSQTSIPFATSINLFCKTGIIPADTHPPVKLIKSYNAIAFTGHGNEYYDTITVDTLSSADSLYGFTTQIVWNDTKTTAIGVYNGCTVLMRNTKAPENKLLLTGKYTPFDTAEFVIDNVQTIDWNSVDSVTLWYGTGNDSTPDFTNPLKVTTWGYQQFTSSIQNGKFYYRIVDNQFNSDPRILNWAVILTGKNRIKSQSVKSFFYVGRIRTENTVTLQAHAVNANTIQLSWNRQTGIDKLRIYYTTKKSIPFDNSFTDLDSINIPPDDVSYSLNQLTEKTRYYFAAQVFKNGMWSNVTSQSSATDSTPEAVASMITNTIKIKSVYVDSTNDLITVNWSIDSGSISQLQIGISYTTALNTAGDSLVFQVHPVTQSSGTIAIPFREAIEFDKDYTILMRLRRTNEQWTNVTPDSKSMIHYPKFGSQNVTYVFKTVRDSTLWVNNTIKFTTPPTPVTTPRVVTGRISAFIPSESNLKGFINVSNGFYFTQKSVLDSFFIGLKCHSIPAGYSISNVRIYRFDGVSFLIEPNTIIDSSSQFVSVKTADLYRPFIALIDTLPPVITLLNKRDTMVMVNTDYFDTLKITDNIANQTWYYKSSNGGDPSFTSGYTSPKITLSKCEEIIIVQTQKKYTGDDGARSIVYTDDGASVANVDLSRRVRMASCDTVQTIPQQWVPLKVASQLDTTTVSGNLRNFFNSTVSSGYDIKHMRLFRWYPLASNSTSTNKWVEYSPVNEDIFRLTSGKLLWVKTREQVRINLGTGISMSFTDTVKILLIPKNWTDFGLPFHFDMRLSAILADSRKYSSKIDSVQFYQWNMDTVSGRFTASAFYIPDLPGVTDPARIMSSRSKTGFTAWNPTNDTITLAFVPSHPMTNLKPPVVAKPVTHGGWAVKVVSALSDGHTISPVICGLDPLVPQVRYYPVPPSFDEICAGVVDSSGNINAHMVVNRMINGGSSFTLAFTNNSVVSQQVRFRLEMAGTPDQTATAAIFDKKNNVWNFPDSAGFFTLEIEHATSAYRQLLVGSDEYIRNFRNNFVPCQLTLTKVFPNPIRKSAIIRYSLPYLSVNKVEFFIIDIMGRTVWQKTDTRSIAGGNHAFSWKTTNSSSEKIRSGIYLLKMIAYNDNNNVIGQFDQKLTVLP